MARAASHVALPSHMALPVVMAELGAFDLAFGELASIACAPGTVIPHRPGGAPARRVLGVGAGVGAR